MQLVMLAGELGEKYGKHHEYYNLQTPADAIKLLCINYPALKQELMQEMLQRHSILFLEQLEFKLMLLQELRYLR